MGKDGNTTSSIKDHLENCNLKAYNEMQTAKSAKKSQQPSLLKAISTVQPTIFQAFAPQKLANTSEKAIEIDLTILRWIVLLASRCMKSKVRSLLLWRER